tara:strand:- start:276 stop:512 length:237 start_codon:yes stop_codon:yes gene_type:complete
MSEPIISSIFDENTTFFSLDAGKSREAVYISPLNSNQSVICSSEGVEDEILFTSNQLKKTLTNTTELKKTYTLAIVEA